MKMLYYIIASFSFCLGFLLCAILTNSKNREYQEIKTWQKEFEGKDIIHDGSCYKAKV